MKVIKRDGKIKEYDFGKVRKAVSETFKSCGQEPDKEFLMKLKTVFTEWADGCPDCEVSVDEIRDLVEKTLKKEGFKEVLKAAKKERDKRDRIRESKTKKSKDIKSKIEATNVENQNANVDELSFGGRRGEADSVVMKEYALYNCMSEMARNNHLGNLIYTHDLDSYAVGMHNCLSIPFDDLLSKGFNTRQTDVRPANSVNTAFQLVAVIFQLQSLQQFGGVSATHIDWTMVPYVRKSFMKHYIMAYIKDSEEFLGLDLIKMVFDTYAEKIYDEDNIFEISRNKFEDWVESHKEEFFDKTGLKEEDFYLDNKNLNKKYYQSALLDTLTETKQAVEGMYHNLNTLQSRSGNQLPFTSINYGTCTSTEGRIVIEAILRVSIEGLGKLHKTPIFPCGIFQSMEGVNRKEGDKNYDLFKLALKSTAKRLYPNYANVDWSGNAGYDINDPRTYFSTMGCRTANGLDINGLGQLKDGRGNICPVTIIMPTLAMEAINAYGEINWPCKNDGSPYTVVDEFMKLLDKKIHEAKDQLIERFEWICKQPADSAKFMYENGTMAGYDGKDIRSALKHGTLAIGQIALAETLQILIGCDHTTEKGMELAIEIEKLFSKRCKEFKEKYKLNFGVYYTPAENLCYTSYKKFIEKYGHINGITNYWKEAEELDNGTIIPAHWEPRNYFTNSMHVPVWYEMDPFNKIDIESKLTSYSNAGCITYVELPSSCEHNIEALETLILYMMYKDIPYAAVNVPNDQCMHCGWVGEIGNKCPICGGTVINRLRRVTGYLTGNYLTAFNPGKVCETNDRVKHVKD